MNRVNAGAYCIRPTFTAIIAIATAFTLNACNEQPTNSGGGSGTQGSVAHGGKSYKTVKIGEQWWMAENLDYDAPGSECYYIPCLSEEPCGPLTPNYFPAAAASASQGFRAAPRAT